MRRRLFRWVFLATGLVRPALCSGFSARFRHLLRLPRRDAARLDRETAFFDYLAELEWLALLRRSRAGLRDDFGRIAISDDATLRGIAETGRPVVLAPLHMGAYTACLGEIMFRYFPDRPMLILRRRDDMPMETRVMERIRTAGINMRFLKVTERADYLAAIRFARKGGVIVAFCDLPPSYGIPETMPMFGETFRFAFGLDSLARLTDGIVLPLSTVSTLDGDEVRLSAPFEVCGGSAEDRARAASHIQRHIRIALTARPEQWHLWSILDQYLQPPGVTEAPRAETHERFVAEAAE